MLRVEDAQKAAAEHAQAEAEATRVVSQAIAAGNGQAVNYFVAQKYVEAFAELARSPQQRTVIVPAEMSGLVGTLAGVGELVGLAREQQSRTPSPAPAPQPQRTAQSRTPSTRPAGGGSVPRT